MWKRVNCYIYLRIDILSYDFIPYTMFLLWVSYSIFVLLTAQNYARFFSMSLCLLTMKNYAHFFAIQLFLNLSSHLLFCVAIVAEFDCLMISFDYAI